MMPPCLRRVFKNYSTTQTEFSKFTLSLSRRLLLKVYIKAYLFPLLYLKAPFKYFPGLILKVAMPLPLNYPLILIAQVFSPSYFYNKSAISSRSPSKEILAGMKECVGTAIQAFVKKCFSSSKSLQSLTERKRGACKY